MLALNIFNQSKNAVAFFVEVFTHRTLTYKSVHFPNVIVWEHTVGAHYFLKRAVSEHFYFLEVCSHVHQSKSTFWVCQPIKVKGLRGEAPSFPLHHEYNQDIQGRE